MGFVIVDYDRIWHLTLCLRLDTADTHTSKQETFSHLTLVNPFRWRRLWTVRMIMIQVGPAPTFLRNTRFGPAGI